MERNHLGRHERCQNLSASQTGWSAPASWKFFGNKPISIEHILEIGVAADIQLICSIQPHSTISQQISENAVQNGGTNLALDVVTDNWKAGFFEAAPPNGI